MAVGGNMFGDIITGDNSRVVHLPSEVWRPPGEVDARPGLDNVPLHVRFVGRERELDRLDSVLTAPGQVVVQAVHGLGGIGKSALVAQWAATRSHGHNPIRWITADSAANVQQGLAAFAVAVEPMLAQAFREPQLAEWALQWLATHAGWLLVLDNVNDPADIADLLARTITSDGRVVITSRLATGWQPTNTIVRLEVLRPDESLMLLTRILTEAGSRDLNGATDLCSGLGHLPLAIEQAAAYMAQNPLTNPRDYLELYTRYFAEMHQRTGAAADSERTVARVWQVTMNHIATTQPFAAHLLSVLAWYAPDDIPVTLLDGLADPATFDVALGMLAAYNMITLDPVNRAVSVHRLVQAVTRTAHPDDPHRTPAAIGLARDHATTQLLTALDTNAPHAPTTWPLWRRLGPHVNALADRTEPGADSPTLSYILNLFGNFLREQGQIASAVSLLRRALDGETSAGGSQATVLMWRSHLARAYQDAGDLGQAIPLFEGILADFEQQSGPDHPTALHYRTNLAVAYRAAGDVGRAIPLFERILADYERELVPRQATFGR
ncbi:tetratricopeptide repeat protein [Nocardia wallacei]|uniref:tetratricopeptide repeat protein n=1 Tax=Nocardia wallacei TaxID=480035 RepID=UPI002457523F|nr:tetratricopeptide repeat protein [Nocardia wallacei]